MSSLIQPPSSPPSFHHRQGSSCTRKHNASIHWVAHISPNKTWSTQTHNGQTKHSLALSRSEEVTIFCLFPWLFQIPTCYNFSLGHQNSILTAPPPATPLNWSPKRKQISCIKHFEIASKCAKCPSEASLNILTSGSHFYLFNKVQKHGMTNGSHFCFFNKVWKHIAPWV
jgi:hypothetical protein